MTARSDRDLPRGYRWAEEHEMGRLDAIVVARSVDNKGTWYTKDEADLAVPTGDSGGVWPGPEIVDGTDNDALEAFVGQATKPPTKRWDEQGYAVEPTYTRAQVIDAAKAARALSSSDAVRAGISAVLSELLDLPFAAAQQLTVDKPCGVKLEEPNDSGGTTDHSAVIAYLRSHPDVTGVIPLDQDTVATLLAEHDDSGCSLESYGAVGDWVNLTLAKHGLAAFVPNGV